MEENSTTMNLGNLQAGGIPATEIPATSVNTEIVAPVSDLKIDTNPISVVTETLNQTQVSIASKQSNLSQQLPEQPVAPVFTQTTVQAQPAANPPTPPVEPKVEEKKPVERTDYDIMIVKTTILQNLLDNVLKIITYEARSEISTIVQLVFSAQGLEVKSANGIEAYIYQKNSEWTYSTLDEYSICLDSQFLQKLVSKITAPYITFERSVNDQRIILVKAGSAEYQLPEKLDPNSGETINVEMPVSFDDVTPITLTNYDKFKAALNKCLPFAAESDGNPVFKGVYCGNNYIVGSNGDTICIMDSIPELNNAVIYLPKEFAKKITSINIDGKIDLAWKKTEGRLNPSMIKIHSVDIENKTEIVITGMLQEDEHYNDFPIQPVIAFKQMQFGQTFTSSRNEFKEAIDRTSLFFQMTDQNQLNIAITPGNMNIKSLSGGSDENVKVEGCLQPLNVIRMDATQINLMLDNLSSNQVIMKADNANPGLMSVTDEDSLIILSEAHGV